LEGWEKVFINYEEFPEDVHGEIGCTECHGGNGAFEDKEQAHEGVLREPIAIEDCGKCHEDKVESDSSSLHSTLRGYETVLQQRTSEETFPMIMEEAFGNHCGSCHTSCGQCHVSRPTNLGGGLTAGHEFKKVPPMNLTCTGCHGSRIEMEFKGRNEGIPADLHWTKGGMPCFDCHTADEMHGELDFEQNHRYDGPAQPACTDCHPEVIEEKAEFTEHRSMHVDNLACQVCHVAEYKQCYSCHVQKSEEEEIPFFTIEPSVMDVKIGYNPIQSEDRPWKWVVLRHVPVDPDTFAYYGDDLLPNFSSRPTWVYATPHTIQRLTPQTESCDNCHGNEALFLTEEDLLPYEIEANQEVIVDKADIPEPRE
jgi:hypothetical protein